MQRWHSTLRRSLPEQSSLRESVLVTDSRCMAIATQMSLRFHLARTAKTHWEIKGRFRKRVVLANLPSSRFSFRVNMPTYPRFGFRSGGTSECALVPGFVPGEHPPKPPFWKTTLLATPERHLQWLSLWGVPSCQKGWHIQKIAVDSQFPNM